MPIELKANSPIAQVLIFLVGPGSDELAGVLRKETTMSLFGMTDSEYRDLIQTSGKGNVICLPYGNPSSLNADNLAKQKAARNNFNAVTTKESYCVNIFVDMRQSPLLRQPPAISTWIPDGDSSELDMKNALESAERTAGILFSDDFDEPREVKIAAASKNDPHNFWIKCTHAICITGSEQDRENIKKIVNRFVFSVFK